MTQPRKPRRRFGWGVAPSWGIGARVRYTPPSHMQFDQGHPWRPGMTGVIAGTSKSRQEGLFWPVLWDNPKARTHPDPSVAAKFTSDGACPIIQEFLELIS